MTEPLIRVHDLSFSYHAGTDQAMPALRGVRLEIWPGEYVALIGPNGSGKSTLARHLNALLLPTAGQVWVKGMDTADPVHRREICRTVAMVFQNPDNQIVATVVEEDVAFGPENLGLPEEELHRRVTWALEVVGLAALRHRSPHHLSAGQKQRLALAGALAMQPACLVLDEATALLDPAGRRDVLEVVRRQQQEGMAVVAITQAMEEAALADRLVVLSEGRVILEGTPHQVFAEEGILQALGLDLPPAARLAWMVRQRVPDLAWPLTPAELVTVLSERLLPAEGGTR